MLRNVPLFGVGNQARSIKVSAQQRKNLYVEIQQDPEVNGLVLYPTPGLSTLINFGANPIRGMYEKGDVLYVVVGSTLWEVAANGTTTSRGTLTTSGGRVDMESNGDQLLIVDGTYGYTLTYSGNTFAQIADADFVAGDTCAFLNGRFIIQRASSGEFGISALYDGTAYDATEFATAEASPDNLQRVVVDNGVIYLFGDKTIEPWGDSGAEDFPFAPIGAAAIDVGLAARWALAKFDRSMMFLGRNRLGGVQVFMLSGTTAVPVSSVEVENAISAYSAVSDATAFSYMVAGHPMFQLNFPTADESWLYDGQSKQWNRLQSGEGRHRANIQVNFQNRTYVADYENGKLYELDPDVYTDDGTYIVREVITRHQKSGEPTTVDRLWIEMEPGVGLVSGQGSDPQVMLQVSRDGGKTWGTEMWRSFGAIGEYKARAVWDMLGSATDWVFKIRVTDPVKTVFLAGWAEHDA